MHGMLKPERLRPGARVALIAPAGPVTEERISTALARCEALGLVSVPGASVRERHRFLAGTDELRLADLTHAMQDPDIDAIWALRGGYGTMRLLHALDPAPLVARPKAYIGFSDNTALHLAFTRAHLVSFHGPHAGGDFPPLAEECFRRVLFHATPPGELPVDASDPPVTLVPGTARGPLAGGNLSLLASACGTTCGLDAHGAILFLEEVGEPAYRVDRALTQLRLSGCLDGVQGLVLGRFTEAPEDGDAEVMDVLEEFAHELGVPAIAGAPIGHVPDNWTLPIGVAAELRADDGRLSITEAAVR